MNNVSQSCIGYTGGNVANRPTSDFVGGRQLTIKTPGSGGVGFQWWRNDDTNKLYMRYYQGSSSGAWKEI